LHWLAAAICSALAALHMPSVRAVIPWQALREQHDHS
jgi:hypothetical protein